MARMGVREFQQNVSIHVRRVTKGKDRQDRLLLEAGLHQVHPSKTAGTTVSRTLQALDISSAADGRPVHTSVGHALNLDHIFGGHPGNAAFFFVREPLARYVSGFNSRFREGAPAYHNPWKINERRVFEVFTTLNDMAEALTSADSERRDLARYGMTAVAHLPRTYGQLFKNRTYLEAHLDRLFFVGFVESFDEDMATLCRRLGHEPPPRTEQHHRAPPDSSTVLSDVAQATLRQWYADDILIYEWLLARRDRWRLGAA